MNPSSSIVKAKQRKNIRRAVVKILRTVFQERGRNGIIPSEENINEQVTKFCNSRELVRPLADRVGRIPIERLAVVRPLSHSAPSLSEAAAGAAEVNPVASPGQASTSSAWAPTGPQPGSVPASPDWAPASPGVGVIGGTSRTPVPDAIPIVNLIRIAAPTPDPAPTTRPFRASALAASTAIRELVDLTIEPDSEPDRHSSSSDEADSSSDEAESEWEEFSSRSDDEDKSESKAERDDTSDRRYIRDNDILFPHRDRREWFEIPQEEFEVQKNASEKGTRNSRTYIPQGELHKTPPKDSRGGWP